ncbi:MAG: hypothetical protein ACRDZN_09300 [Acidimicrobiales bacterium]
MPSLRGLTDSKEGRLAIIVVVGGILLVGGTLANGGMSNAADDHAGDVRWALRHDLAAVSDETLAGYPGSRDVIESAAERAVRDMPARLIGSVWRDDDEMVVVAVETRWGLHSRCITAELRGSATVLTEVGHGSC